MKGSGPLGICGWIDIAGGAGEPVPLLRTVCSHCLCSTEFRFCGFMVLLLRGGANIRLTLWCGLGGTGPAKALLVHCTALHCTALQAAKLPLGAKRGAATRIYQTFEVGL